MHRRVNVNHAWLSPRLLLSVCGLLLVLLLAGCDLMGASGTPTPVVTATPAGPTDTPVPPTETPVPPTNTPSPRTLAGHVLDAYSGRPISGARVTAGTSASGSAADGGYDLGVVAPGTMVEAAAPGYAPATVDSSAGATLDIS
ncbi:MAG TPA: carboxypeptidase-like regulatory domain-containing protein, partial [Chloroflexia bacterium]|nr:carboxypeptidase-like regulatory domain-containing protein [Chloroflexia bacterium]